MRIEQNGQWQNQSDVEKAREPREHEPSKRTVSRCPGRETGFGRTRDENEKGRDAVWVDRRDDRAEWLSREGGGGKQEKLQHRGRANNDRGEESCREREKDPM